MKFFNSFKLLLLLPSFALHASGSYTSTPQVAYQGMRYDGTHIAVLNTSKASLASLTLSVNNTFASAAQSSNVVAATKALTSTYNQAEMRILQERFEALSSNSNDQIIFLGTGLANVPTKINAQTKIINSLYSDHVQAMSGASIKELLVSKDYLARTIEVLNCQFGTHNEFTRLRDYYQALQQRSLTNKPLLDFIPENMREVYLKKGIEHYEGQARIAGYEKCLKFNDIALRRIADQLKLVQEWNKQLPQVKELVLAGGVNTDQSLIKALDDKQLTLQRMSKVITKEVGELLTHCQIPQDTINKLIGNASQKYFFDQAHGVIADAAQLFARYKNDPNICAYVKATTLTSAATIEMIRKSNVTEVIRHSQLSEILQAATHATINFSKGVIVQPLNAALGIGKGLVEVTTVGVVTAAGIAAYPAVGTGALTLAAGTAAYSLMYCDTQKIIDAINAFQKLPIDQQSQGITVLVASIYNPLTKNSYSAPIIQNLEKAIGKEFVALSSLYKVDQATIVTHKGVTFAKEFEQLLKPYIDSCKLTTQEDVIRCLSEFKAPFLTSCKASVEYVVPATQEVAATGLFKGAIHDVAQVKAGQEAIAAGPAGSQVTEQQMIARTDPMAQAGAQGSAQTKPLIAAHPEPNVQLTATQKAAEVSENISNLGTQSATATGTVQPASKVIETIQPKWWETYQNKWTGNLIKEFDIQTLNVKNIVEHMYKQKHNLKILGKTDVEIMNNIISEIKKADFNNLLKNGLTSQIRTTISNQLVEIRVHIENGKVVNINTFVIDPTKGYSNRNLGNIIQL
jgi:hypothetical protein